MAIHRFMRWRGLPNVVRGLDVGDARIIHDSALCGFDVAAIAGVSTCFYGEPTSGTWALSVVSPGIEFLPIPSV